MASSLHEWARHKIWEVARYVYVDEFNNLDQPGCNVLLYSVAAKKRDILRKMRWCGAVFRLWTTRYE